jgi:putative transcriptional regulator
MDMNVIYWKLNELMARKRVRNKDLANALGITENSVYRLRKTDMMPRLSPERLNGICNFLQCQPGELLVWTPDNEPQSDLEIEKFQSEPLEEKPRRDKKTRKQPDSFLEVLCVFPESA